MKKNKFSKRTIALIAAAVILFAGGGYTGSRALLTVTSDVERVEFNTDDQNVAIVNSDGVITESNPLLPSEKLTPGKAATVNLAARNDSSVDQYVRMIVRKYWKDAEGNKVTDFEAVDGKVAELDMISLGLGDSNNWKINADETTPERTVYYYKEIVPSRATTDVLIKDVTVSSDVLKDVTIETENKITTYTYVFDGYSLCLEAEAQSIQTHNADKAFKSIWGVEKSVID